MARIFAYIAHKDGVPDDSAAELLAAAKKIDPAASPTAIVTGCGRRARCGLRLACALPTPKSGRSRTRALAYPNAELVRQALVKVLPAGSIVLVRARPFRHRSRARALDQAECSLRLRCGRHRRSRRQHAQGGAPGIRRTSQRACPLRHLLRRGDQPASGRIQSRSRTLAASGTVVDKSAEVGALTAERRYLETVVAEAGDVDITKEPVLVSIGRGIQEQDNVAIAEELAEAMGAAVSCSRPVVDAKWLEKSRQVGSSGQDREAQGLSGLRHQRLVPAPGRAQGQSVHRRHQQESQGPDLPGGRRRHRRRHSGVPAGADRQGPRS